MGQAFDVGGRGEEGLLTAEDFLNAVSQGLPILAWDIQPAQVEDDPVTGSPGCSYRLHQAVIGEGLVRRRVLLDDLFNEHGDSIPQREGDVKSPTIYGGLQTPISFKPLSRPKLRPLKITPSLTGFW